MRVLRYAPHPPAGARLQEPRSLHATSELRLTPPPSACRRRWAPRRRGLSARPGGGCAVRRAAGLAALGDEQQHQPHDRAARRDRRVRLRRRVAVPLQGRAQPAAAAVDGAAAAREAARRALVQREDRRRGELQRVPRQLLHWRAEPDRLAHRPRCARPAAPRLRPPRAA